MATLNQERFTLASDDTIEELQNMVQKIWTPAKVHRLFWLSVWKMWCEGKSKALEIEAHQLPEMNRLVLKKFYAEVKNKIHMFFWHFLHANFIMFIIIWFFSFYLELICTCEFFKSWNCTCWRGCCNFSFLKNSLIQIDSKLNWKLYDYPYKQH